MARRGTAARKDFLAEVASATGGTVAQASMARRGTAARNDFLAEVAASAGATVAQVSKVLQGMRRIIHGHLHYHGSHTQLPGILSFKRQVVKPRPAQTKTVNGKEFKTKAVRQQRYRVVAVAMKPLREALAAVPR